MKNILIETQLFKANKIQLTEARSEAGNPIVEGILATVEQKNGNNRYYSRELWEREMSKYNNSINENRALNELDHPDSQVINLKNVCSKINKIWWKGDDIMGQIEILPTPAGNILNALLQNGITVGVSSRGMGSLQEVDGLNVVQDDFELLCWDFVSTPSNPGSWMKPISLNESQGLVSKSKYYNVNNIITSIISK